MAFTPEQEKALLEILKEKRVTLSELPAATSVNNTDLLLTRQGITDKSITPSVLQAYLTEESLKKNANLSDVADVDQALKNLRLGEAAKRDIGTGPGQVPDMGSFGLSAKENGWIMLPNGFLLQWGVTDEIKQNKSQLILLPLAFPNYLLSIQATPEVSPGTTSGQSIAVYSEENKKATRISVSNTSTADIDFRAFWLAIGL